MREVHWRDDEPDQGVGFVVKSAYFPRKQNEKLRGSWWQRWLGRVGLRSYLGWQLPFDDDGRDCLGLMRAGEGQRVVGTLHSNEQTTLVWDAWANDPSPWRVAKACDFTVAPDEGPPVIISLGLAPIVIAPRRVELNSSVIDGLSVRHRRMLPAHLGLPRYAHNQVSVVELRTGDRVEVIGVARPIQQSARRLDRVGYRDAARAPHEVIGDEDGTRVVLRWLPQKRV